VPLQTIPVAVRVEPFPLIDVIPAAAAADPSIFESVIVIVPNNCSVQSVPPAQPNTSMLDPFPTNLDILSAEMDPDTVEFLISIVPIVFVEHDMLVQDHADMDKDVPCKFAVIFVIPILSVILVKGALTVPEKVILATAQSTMS
jgi:hypothetical protein